MFWNFISIEILHYSDYTDEVWDKSENSYRTYYIHPQQCQLCKTLTLLNETRTKKFWIVMCDRNEQYTVYIVINKIEYWVVIINNMKYIILYNSYQIHINQDDLTVTSNSII